MPRGNKLTTEQWIALAVAKHGHKYDYSATAYTGSQDKLQIKCGHHGEFWQNARSHLNGRGCPACGKDQSASKHTLTSTDWIAKAKTVHGDQYDYTETQYFGSLQDVTIRCSTHGLFTQRAENHLQGSGCFQCNPGSRRSSTLSSM